MMRRPPRSTLFPYTTLSDLAITASEHDRLRHADFNALGADEYRLVERLARDIALALPEVASRRTRAGGRGSRPHWARTLREAGDRKSTRLNSSHANISYAVF